MLTVFLPPSTTVTEAVISEIQQLFSSSSSECSEHSLALVKDLQYLIEVFKWLQEVFHNAVERDIQDESMKLWLSELKDVAYDVDDVLDEFHYEMLHAQVEDTAIADAKFSVPLAISYLIKFFSETDLPKRIEDIKERLEEISDARKDYWLGEEIGLRRTSSAATYIPIPTTHQVKSDVYGRDVEKEQVIELLLSENGHKISGVAIFGMGGLGKTTLAQLVYNDLWVSARFDKRIWVYVHEDLDVVCIARTMVEELSGNPCSISELAKLKEILDEDLKGKKVLLVLDDVWNERLSPWDSLEKLLEGAKAVTILVTTRNNQITEVMKNVQLYCLSYLSEIECWNLFENYAFSGRVSSEFPSLIKMGKEIVKKCQGLPLAVKSLGCLLQYEDDEDFWDDVLKSELWDLPEQVEILPALKISYNRMPSYLRPCFAFCSIFPKGYNFDKDYLTYLWIAQGFIECKAGERLEYMGKRYIDELVSRAFLDFEFNHANYHCMKMHDKIHDLANFVSNGLCNAIVGNLQCFGTMQQVRHLYCNSPTQNNAINPDILRTYVVDIGKEAGEICLPLECMTRLRVLNFKFVANSDFLNIIGKLRHLRYLCIKKGRIPKFPDSISYLYKLQTLQLLNLQFEVLPVEFGNLVNLRTLCLEHCSKLKELPYSVGNFSNLLFLSLTGCSELKELPDSMGNLSNMWYLDIKGTALRQFPTSFWVLENLEVIYVHNTIQVKEVEGLKNLSKLRVPICISGLNNIVNLDDPRKANLKNKPRIATLQLSWYEYARGGYNCLCLEVVRANESFTVADNKDKHEVLLQTLCPHANLKELEIYDYPGACYPLWISNLSSFTKLTQITLSGCRPPCLPSLGQLPFLHALLIEECPIRSLGRNFYCFNDDITRTAAFRELTFMELGHLTKLEEWTAVRDGDFPKLKDLNIYGCDRLSTLPSIRSSVALEDHQNSYSIRTTHPSWAFSVSFTMLRKITLGAGVTCLPTLGQLPSLESLSIRSCPVKMIGPQFCWSEPELKRSVAFPALGSLRLYDLKELEVWHGVLDGDFPQLTDLTIKQCHKLRSLPILPPSILKVEDCPLLVVPKLNRKLRRLKLPIIKQL